MDDGYKEFECYKHMSDHDKDCFDKLTMHYSGFLGNGKTENATSTRFTLHDFEHHCFDIYKYISEVILSKAAYGENGLSKRELYILNLSVLFHDISLHLVDDCERGKHARQSADWLRREHGNRGSTFSDLCDLADTEVDALCAVISAHSDEKDADGKTGIYNQELIDYPSKQKEIRTQLLAGILRLTDELDITTMRIGDLRFETELRQKAEEFAHACSKYQTATDSEIRKNAEKEMERLRPKAESYRHWDKLHYFEEVRCANTSIVLKVRKRKIEEETARGNEEHVEKIIGDVFLKVSEEFLKIQKVLFKPRSEHRTIIAVDKVEVSGIEEQLQKRMEREYQRLKNEIENGIEKSEKSRANKLTGTSEIEKLISDFVDSRKLLLPGHFIMNSRYCAADWIDTPRVMENMDIYRSCLDLYLENIKKTNLNDALLVGLDLQGALIVSAIGYMLGVPFTYLIPVHKKQENSERDSRLDFDNQKNIILFTDVIVTTQSIDDACESYDIQRGRIKAIYAVFYRPIKSGFNVESLSESYADKIYYINDKYAVNLLNRQKCKERDTEKCLACNKQVELGGDRT